MRKIIWAEFPPAGSPGTVEAQKKSFSFYREALGLSAVQLVATYSLDSPFPERSLPFENLIRFCRTMGFSYLYMGVSSAKFEIKGW